MLFEQIIREALTPTKATGVPVRPHVRKRPTNPKREAVHDALRRAVSA